MYINTHAVRNNDGFVRINTLLISSDRTETTKELKKEEEERETHVS